MRSTGAKKPGRRMVVRAFEGPDRAQSALAELKDAEFQPEQVSVVARDPGVSRQVVECGKMGTCGGRGRLVRALMACGVPKEEACDYEKRRKQGQILLLVRVDTDQEAQRAERIFEDMPAALEPWRDFEYAIKHKAVSFEQLAYAHLARRPEFETRRYYRAQASYYYRDLLTSFCKRHGNITDMYDRYWPPGAPGAGIFAIVTSEDELWVRHFKRAFATPSPTAEVEDFLGRLYAEARTAHDILPPGTSRHNHVVNLFALTYSTLVLLDTMLSAPPPAPTRPPGAPASASTRAPFVLSFRGVALTIAPPPQAAGPAPGTEVLTRLQGRFDELRRQYESVAQREARRKYFEGMLLVLLVLAAGLGDVVVARLLGYLPAAVLDYALPGVAGAVGAVFSVMSRVAGGAFALDWRLGWKANRELGYNRPLIGAIIGVALVVLLKGTLLVVNVPQGTDVLFTYTGLAFLAGFSERFASVVLTRAETRAVPTATDPAVSRPAPTAESPAPGRAASAPQADVAQTPAQDPGRLVVVPLARP